MNAFVRKGACALLSACMAVSACGCSGPDVSSDPEPVDPVDLPFVQDGMEDGPGDGQVLVSDDGDPVIGLDPVERPDDEIPMPADGSAGFAGDLAAYLSASDWSERNYAVSPVSLRAALCLAIAGAGGDTLDGLLGAACFGSVDDAAAWYGDIADSVEAFAAAADERRECVETYGDGGDLPDWSFVLANSIWDNSDVSCGFSADYVDRVGRLFNAAAKSVPAGSITDEVNSWCESTTDGAIKSISDDLSDCAAVLANALYLKAPWVESFPGAGTEPDIFTGLSGSCTEIDFMNLTDEFPYACVDGVEYLVVPMEGGKQLLCCLGPEGDLAFSDLEALPSILAGMSYRRVSLRMPKLDVETSFEDGELARFVADRGAADAFVDGIADFSPMTGDPDRYWHVGDIVQKTRVKSDEDGLEAAAVTAIMMMDNAMVGPPPEDPIPFVLDRPWSFAVLSGDVSSYGGDMDCGMPEILFFGQMVEAA